MPSNRHWNGGWTQRRNPNTRRLSGSLCSDFGTGFFLFISNNPFKTEWRKKAALNFFRAAFMLASLFLLQCRQLCKQVAQRAIVKNKVVYLTCIFCVHRLCADCRLFGSDQQQNFGCLAILPKGLADFERTLHIHLVRNIQKHHIGVNTSAPTMACEYWSCASQRKSNSGFDRIAADNPCPRILLDETNRTVFIIAPLCQARLPDDGCDTGVLVHHGQGHNGLIILKEWWTAKDFLILEDVHLHSGR